MRLRARSFTTTVGLLVLLAGHSGAQTAQVMGRPIVDIQFPAGPVLDPADLAKAIDLKKGEPLREQDVASSIDGLFATGRFQDIVVEVERSGDGVVVRFVTKNTWFLGGVSIEGKVSAPPNRGELTNSANQLVLGAPFEEQDVTKALDSMKHLLESNGLYESKITPSIERDDKAQQVFVTFTLKQGKRARYETPVVEGATGLSDSTILRATGWRIPIIHRWRQVTDSLTRKGVQGLLGRRRKRLKAV